MVKLSLLISVFVQPTTWCYLIFTVSKTLIVANTILLPDNHFSQKRNCINYF